MVAKRPYAWGHPPAEEEPSAISKARLTLLRDVDSQTYRILTFDLGVARANVETKVWGDALAVVTITGTASIRLNEPDNEDIDLSLVRELPAALFHRFFITNTVQAGKTLTLIIGKATLFTAIALRRQMLADKLGLDINPATEDTLVKLIPIAKGSIFNTAQPAADNDLFGAALAPTNSPSIFRVTICMSNAGLFYARRTVAAVSVDEYFQSKAALVATAVYAFDLPVRSGDTLNFRYSVTGGTTLVLRVDEIGAAA
jgi:hypothetical protein